MFEWNSFAFISLICCLMSSASAILTLAAKRQGEALLWGLICVLLACWTFMLFLCFSADTPEQAYAFALTLNYIVIFLPVLLFHFSVIFVRKTVSYQRITVLYYCLSIAYLILVLVFPEHFLHSPTLRFDAFWFPFAGPLFYFYLALYALVIGHTLYILMQAKVGQNKQQSRKIDYLITTILIGFIGAGSSLGIEFGIDLPPYGILSIAFAVLVATYAILRHDLLDLPETISLITARVLIYIAIFAVVVGVIKFGAFFDNIRFSGFQILVVSMLMVLICELYALMKSRVQYLSDKMLTNRKLVNDRCFKALISDLEKAADFEAMLPLLRGFFETQSFIYHYAWYLDRTLLVQSLQKEALGEMPTRQGDALTYQRILFSAKDGRRLDKLPASLRLSLSDSSSSSSQMVDLMSSEQLDQAYKWVEQVPQRELIALPLIAKGSFRGLVMLVVSQTETEYADQVMLQTLCAKLSELIERLDSIAEASRIQQSILLDKMQSLQSLAGEVANEMRLPLSQLDAFTSEVYSFGRRLQKDEATNLHELSWLGGHLRAESNKARLAIDRSLQSIEIILKQVSNLPIEIEAPSVFAIQSVVSRALAEYVFVENERAHVACDMSRDFRFKGDQELVVLALFNLLKTAFGQGQYSAEFEISISTEMTSEMNFVIVRYQSLKAIPSDVILNHRGADKEKPSDVACDLDELKRRQLGIAYCDKVMKALGGKLLFDTKAKGFVEIRLGFPLIL